ncbi:MAG: hypothetical protein WCQ16_12740 [Verrucomicrobiae bacterium]
MQADWEIKSRAHVCARTGREFVPGENFYTLLVREADGFFREDLCEEAWESRNENIQPFSFWRSKYEPPAPRPPEPLPRDDAEGLLRRLVAENHPAYNNVRYILALMLERKRMLRPVESSDDDILVYEHVGTGETIVLANPHLSFDQIPDIQREVGALLAPDSNVI